VKEVKRMGINYRKMFLEYVQGAANPCDPLHQQLCVRGAAACVNEALPGRYPVYEDGTDWKDDSDVERVALFIAAHFEEILLALPER
jgi:hypothetical protein